MKNYLHFFLYYFFLVILGCEIFHWQVFSSHKRVEKSWKIHEKSFVTRVGNPENCLIYLRNDFCILYIAL